MLHDLGNPPFGHFGEIAISDWFHLRADDLKPPQIGGATLRLWEQYYADFRHFDGNPQGLQICTTLQPQDTEDLNSLNLTATTLAATLKYPWASNRISRFGERGDVRKKAGYFHTESHVVQWIHETVALDAGRRHPLVYLMEAADDISYCVSDIEDGIEKGLIAGREFAEYVTRRLEGSTLAIRDNDVDDMKLALDRLGNPQHSREGSTVDRLTSMQDFRSAVLRFLARQAGLTFKTEQAAILKGTAAPTSLRWRWIAAIDDAQRVRGIDAVPRRAWCRQS